MERILGVKVWAPVASFRRPLDHNYQRTLPLPPPTTLIGIAGAALGLSDRELWAPNGPGHTLKVSVVMENQPGRAQDLWTVLKVKGGKIADRSPYVRELLFFVRYTLLYGGEDSLLSRLKRAFEDPAYPLSLGREDELLMVEEVRIDEARPGIPRFRGTVLPGDIRNRGPRVLLEPGAHLEPPVIEQLPLSFRIDRQGLRHPERPIILSFLPPGMELEVAAIPKETVRQWQGRNFVWIHADS